MEDNQKLLREIEIARLEFIGASLVAIGDGIVAYTAALALELLERERLEEQQTRSQSGAFHFAVTQNQLDYFIHELMKIRKTIS